VLAGSKDPNDLDPEWRRREQHLDRVGKVGRLVAAGVLTMTILPLALCW
jgi:hypothetical protein